ncbi:hypothetical protein PROFUN_13625 [Planoprotostelium fungivorum]|uniref:Fungal lipase-type domain-containing protein n=1 Tax=Planoprotostelium fungivorum TaxID=1890364 RepID=A0A2P6MZU9_9EUKA|nr:hypothetical protein PROFUN_13625 [Planoprotostelium fungivorum]
MGQQVSALEQPILGHRSAKRVAQTMICCLLSDAIYHHAEEGATSFTDALHNLQITYSWFDVYGYQLSCPGFPYPFAVVEMEDFFVLTVAGTHRVEDWLTNLDFDSIISGHLNLHRGFELAARHIPILDVYAAATSKKKELIVCGHSRGGAIAQLLNFQLLNRGHHSTCFTFASPVVGCPNWSNEIKRLDPDGKYFFHYVNAYDPVPFLLTHFGSNYSSAGTVILFKRGGNEGEKSKDDDFKSEGTKLFGSHDSVLNIHRYIEGHKMSNYNKCILSAGGPLQLPYRHNTSSDTANNFSSNEYVVPPILPPENIGGEFSTAKHVRFYLKGENLSSITILNFAFNTMNGRQILHEVLPVSKSSIQVISDLDLDDEAYKPDFSISICNGFSTKTIAGKLPFQQVMLLGQTGAGKSHLKAVLEMMEKGQSLPTTPCSIARTIPMDHTPEEMISYGDRIVYREWIGLTRYSNDEIQAIWDNVEANTPVVMIAVINLSTVVSSEDMFEMLNKINFQKETLVEGQVQKYPVVLYALTNPYSVPRSKREITVTEFGKLISKHDPTAIEQDRVFKLNTDPYELEDGRYVPIEGIPEFHHRVRSTLDEFYSNGNCSIRPVRTVVLKGIGQWILQRVNDPKVIAGVFALLSNIAVMAGKAYLKK